MLLKQDLFNTFNQCHNDRQAIWVCLLEFLTEPVLDIDTWMQRYTHLATSYSLSFTKEHELRFAFLCEVSGNSSANVRDSSALQSNDSPTNTSFTINKYALLSARVLCSASIETAASTLKVLDALLPKALERWNSYNYSDGLLPLLVELINNTKTLSAQIGFEIVDKDANVPVALWFKSYLNILQRLQMELMEDLRWIEHFQALKMTDGASDYCKIHYPLIYWFDKFKAKMLHKCGRQHPRAAEQFLGEHYLAPALEGLPECVEMTSWLANLETQAQRRRSDEFEEVLLEEDTQIVGLTGKKKKSGL